MEYHRQPDDLGAGAEVTQGAALGHPARLGRPPAPLNPVSLTLPFFRMDVANACRAWAAEIRRRAEA